MNQSEHILALARRQRLFVEQRLKRVVAQVRGDMDTLDAAFVVQDFQRCAINFVFSVNAYFMPTA